MVTKNELKGKHVSYLSKDGRYHVERVIRITGNTLTVKNCLGRRRRIHISRVHGVMYPKRGLQQIEI